MIEQIFDHNLWSFSHQFHYVQLTTYPQERNQPIALVKNFHNCTRSLTSALKTFINLLSPNPLTRRQLQDSLLPINQINVYHCFKLLPPPLNADKLEKEIIWATPSKKGKTHSRFDTVICVDNDNRGEAESTGLQGIFWILYQSIKYKTCVSGIKIGRIKVIFTFPQQTIEEQSQEAMIAHLPPEPFTYIEWFTKLQPAGEQNHLMYRISKPAHNANGILPGAIISLTDIWQSCQLIPRFTHSGFSEEEEWRSETVLDQANIFYINNWSGLYAYQTIW
jgi:hypothetical protein